MQTITVKYGIESFSKEYQTTPTFGQVIQDGTLKAVLGYGDNVRVLIDGIEQPLENLVPAGATVRIETRANAKAGIITIKIGGSTIQKDVDDGYNAGEVLDFVNGADLDAGMIEPCVKYGARILEDETVIQTGDTVEVVERPQHPDSVATVMYGVESVKHDLRPGETFGQLASNSSLKSILGYGDNVRVLVDGVEQPSSNIVPAGTCVRIETRANAKQS